MTDRNTVAADEELQMLRHQMLHEVRRRRIASWLISLAVLALSIVIAGIGVAKGSNLIEILGEWHTGVVVLAGAALLFSYTMLIHYVAQVRRDVGNEVSTEKTQMSEYKRSKSTSLPI